MFGPANAVVLADKSARPKHKYLLTLRFRQVWARFLPPTCRTKEYATAKAYRRYLKYIPWHHYFYGGPGRNRTCNAAFGGRHDILFTTEPKSHHNRERCRYGLPARTCIDKA